MLDLYLAIVFLTATFLVAHVSTTRLLRGSGTRRLNVIAAIIVSVFLVYVFALRDHSLMARIFPVSALPVLCNWFLPFAGVLTAILRMRSDTSIVRGNLVATALFGTAFWATAEPLHGEPPDCADDWQGNVCLQTSAISCSAACAATLLKTVDIHTTEAEMAELCLTRRGTTWQGLYRGLSLKTQQVPASPEVFSSSLAGLKKVSKDGPLILTVGLTAETAEQHPIYHEQWGWRVGVMHTVIFHGFAPNDRVDMDDPSVGPEQWMIEDLERLWTGRGIRLAR